jgi:hypothetical protein
MAEATEVFIPNEISVHLGSPIDFNAPNVSLPFIDYIAGATLSELNEILPIKKTLRAEKFGDIGSTEDYNAVDELPEECLKANLLAVQTFVLHRLHTNFYRGRGFNFDITSDPELDPSFDRNSETSARILELARELAGVYIARMGYNAPISSVYCDGERETCSGLSKFASINLAENGMQALQILRNYYGNDIELLSTQSETADQHLEDFI